MKKLFYLFSAAAITLAACEDPKPDPQPDPEEPKKVTGVTVEPQTLTLEVGEKQTLEAMIAPSDADNTDVVWSIEGEQFATVDPETGEVEAIAPGSATVTVTTADGGFKATCAVTVNTPEPPVDVLTLITDPAFLAYCNEQMAEWDENEDGMLWPQEAAKVERIEIVHDRYFEGEKVASFAGIENFPNLYYLLCDFNALTELDLSGNTRLVELYCTNNQLTELDVQVLPMLVKFRCDFNQITALDVSGLAELEQFTCINNKLTEVDASDCPKMVGLWCYNNGNLATLDIAGSNALVEVRAFLTSLSSLDVSGRAALEYLDCSYNEKMTALDVSGCSAMTYLDAQFCMLKTLDVSGCSAIDAMYCQFNQLAALDISASSLMTTFACEGNPGDGVSKFPVKAWFDNESIPVGFFTKGYWGIWNEAEDTYPDIYIDYQKVI
ncbi:MAG: Ig-like domain-containing protein [Alistipes sp.]|jgi:hypothetical protein|nr:Ig-like domain-containing protein [Alistipes sp.]